MEDKIRDIILKPSEQAQKVTLLIEGEAKRFYIGNVKEYTAIFGRNIVKKIKLNLIEI